MALSDQLKKPSVRIILAFIAGVLITAATLLITINPKSPPEGVLTCENSDVGIPVTSGTGTIISYEDLTNNAVYYDLSGNDPVFSDPTPDCYPSATTQFMILDANNDRTDGWTMGSTLRVRYNGGQVRNYDYSTRSIGIRRIGNQICIYQ